MSSTAPDPSTTVSAPALSTTVSAPALSTQTTTTSGQNYDVLQVSRAETRKKIIILITVIVIFVGVMMVLSYLGKPCQKSTDTTTPGILCSTSNLVDSTSQLIQGISSHMTAIIAVTAVGIGLGFIGYVLKGYWSSKDVSLGKSKYNSEEMWNRQEGVQPYDRI